MSDLSARLAELSPQKLELLRARLQQKNQAEPHLAPASPPPIEPRLEERYLPFPMTEVQQAYWIGRSGFYELGGGSTSSYMEFEFHNAGRALLNRLEWALQEFIERHDVLRTVVLPDGRLQVLPEVPPFRIGQADLQGRDAGEVEAELLRVRNRMCHEKAPIDRWPLFEFLAHVLDGDRIRLHIRFDTMLMDGTSRGILLDELPMLFDNPEAELAPLTCTYRDFAVTRDTFEQTELFQSSRRYWLERLPALPPAPELPLAVAPGPGTAPRLLVRDLEMLPASAWGKLKARATRAGLTPSGITLAAYAEVIAAWSEAPRFTLGLIGSDRPPVHPQIHQIFGNFNTVYLLAVDDRSGTFVTRARRLQQRLTADFEHRYFSGLRVMRELNRVAGGSSRAIAPVLFNSVLQDSHTEDEPSPAAPPEVLDSETGDPTELIEIEGSVHVPQTLLVPTLLEDRGALMCKWQAAEDLFADGVAAALREAWSGLLARLAESDEPWNEAALDLLPADQRQARETAWARPEARARLKTLLAERACGHQEATAEWPLADQSVRVLTEQGGPRPDWVAGELWLGGRRTGLFARFLPGGEIEVLGRPEEAWAEKQGRWIELRRVEAALEHHSEVQTAVVLPRRDGDGRTRLQAFVLLSGRRAEAAELAEWLTDRLPPHLLPDAIEVFPELPRTTSGAIDREALKARLLPAPTPPPIPVAPRNEIEAELSEIWRDLLGAQPASITDDFFALGGNSLLVVQLMERVARRFSAVKQLHLFFERPTIEHLAGLLQPAADAPQTELGTERRRRSWPRLPWMRRRHEAEPAIPASEPFSGPSAGMRPFLILWFGQLVSTLGTTLGSFSLGVWVVEKTGSTTPFAMIAVIAGIVTLVLSPISGALADRWDRRKLMLFSDVGSALMTMALASLMFTDRLTLWQIYTFVVIMVALSTLQGPALSSSISLLVPRRHLARAAGMSQISRSSAGIIGPFAAGLLVSAVGYHGVIYLDCVTFLFGAATLLLVPIPNPPRAATPFSIFRDLAVGWAYIRERRGLFALLSMYSLTNFCMGIVQVLLTPLILAFATPVELGSVNSAAAGGFLLGSLTLSLWGGPRNRIWAIFAVLVFQGCLLFLGGVEPSIPLISVVMFIFMFTGPIMNGSNQAIFQAKVAPQVQGRVFGMSAFIAACSMPLASAIAGPLVDRVFQPALSPGGALASTFIGHLIGVGPGRGAGLLFVIVGIAVLIIVGFAFLNPRLRRLETELPDAVRQTTRVTDARRGL